MHFSKEHNIVYQDPLQGFNPGQFPPANPFHPPVGNFPSGAQGNPLSSGTQGNPPLSGAQGNPSMPMPKDPKAAALMSGDIDQVFTAFGFEAGFLNRKKFLAQHPEIIEYINNKIGQQRIGPDAEGYKGTSEENGAYINYFKDNAPRIENLKLSGNGPVQSQAMHDPLAPQSVGTAVSPQGMGPALPPEGFRPSVPPQGLVPPVLQTAKPAIHAPDFGPPADFSRTATSPLMPPQSFPQSQSQFQSQAQPQSQPQSAPTYPQAQIQPTYTSEGKGTADYSLDGADVKEEEKEEEAIGIFHEDAGKVPTEPFEESEENTDVDLRSDEVVSQPDAVVSEPALDIENSLPAEATKAPEVSVVEEAGETKPAIKSLADLENLDWWPADDIILDIRDDRHAIMEIVTGSGLVKRSVTWNLSMLENGNFWIFTTDITVPTNERDQILDSEEFQEMIENSY